MCRTQRDSRQVDLKHLCYLLVVSLESITARRCNTLKDPLIWLVKFPGEKQSAIRVTVVTAATLKKAHWPMFLEEMTLTSVGFSMTTMAEAASPMCSSDLGYKYHHFSFFKCAILSGSQGWSIIVGSWRKECEDNLFLPLQDIKDSGHYMSFFFMGITKNTLSVLGPCQEALSFSLKCPVIAAASFTSVLLFLVTALCCHSLLLLFLCLCLWMGLSTLCAGTWFERWMNGTSSTHRSLPLSVFCHPLLGLSLSGNSTKPEWSSDKNHSLLLFPEEIKSQHYIHCLGV